MGLTRSELLETCRKQEARHRKTIEVLERTIDHFRSLAELSPDCIFIIDRELSIRYANSTALRYLGKRQMDVINKPMLLFFPPDTYQRLELHLRRVFCSGVTVTSSERVSFPDVELLVNTKWVPVKELAGRIDSVLCISRDMSEFDSEKPAATQTMPVNTLVLSSREREILNLIAEGMTNKQIGEKLFISPKTVDTHRSRILKKLDAHNAAELIRKARESALLT